LEFVVDEAVVLPVSGVRGDVTSLEEPG